MAIPLNTPNSWANDNEQRFYETLRDCLPDTFYIYADYKNNADPRSNQIDFLVFHISYGIWIMELKSFRNDDIIDCSVNEKWLVRRGREEERIVNPFKQAEENKYYILDQLKKNKHLTNKRNLLNYGKLKFPYNHVVVFDNIEKELLKKKGIFSDEMVLSKTFIEDHQKSEQDWEERFKKMRVEPFRSKLNKTDIDEIQKTLGMKSPIKAINKKEIGITDTRQENLIRESFNQQLLIEGPAGSGKTIIIIKRAIYMKSENPDWKIGIFVFTKFMANYITSLLKAATDPISLDIEVFDIYDFARNFCVNRPDYDKHKKNDPKNYIIPALKEAIDSGFKGNIKFDAILVDEGQDIKDGHAILYKKLLNEETNSITICYDRRQDIYAGESIINELNSKGFNFPSRAKPLIKQQRSLLVFLAISLYEKIEKPDLTIRKLIEQTKKETERMFFDQVGDAWEKEKKEGVLVGFFKTMKAGGKLLVDRFMNKDNESLSKEIENRIEFQSFSGIEKIVEDIAIQIQSLVKENNELYDYSDCLVVFPTRKDKTSDKNIMDVIEENFKQLKIPFAYISSYYGDDKSIPLPKVYDGENISESKDNRLSVDLLQNTVKVMTAHNVKGFDRKFLFVINFDSIDVSRKNEGIKSGALSYVILTRAVEKCFIYYQKETEVINYLKEIINYIKSNEL